MQKTNLVLTNTQGLQDKIVRYERHRENYFIDIPLTYGKLCGYCSKGYLEKRDTSESA